MLRRNPLAGLGLLDALLLACAAASNAACTGGSAASTAPAGFEPARAWAHLEAQVALGARPSGSAALEQTREYIEQELARLELKPVRESFSAKTPKGPVAMVNIYADLPGRERRGAPPPIVILASHFDTKRFDGHWDPARRADVFLGANDGASSTAVLLELARVLAAAGPHDVAYRLLFLDGEEAVLWGWEDARGQTDNRYGSRHHAQAIRKSELRARVKACVLLDMVGDKDLRLHSDQYSDPVLRAIFERAARENGLGRHVGGEKIPIKDDHQSFIEAGIPSVDLIDLDFGPDNSWWHTADDTPENCSAASLGIIGRIVLLGLPALEQHVLGR